MKKIRMIGRDQPTTDYGLLKSGNEYSISDPLAAFLIKRGFAEIAASKKKAASDKK